MKEFDYETAKNTNKIIEKLNHIIKKYDFIDEIKKFDMDIPEYLYTLKELGDPSNAILPEPNDSIAVFMEDNVDMENEDLIKLEDLIKDFKVIYYGRTVETLLEQTWETFGNVNIYRVKTTNIKDYLYYDPMSLDRRKNLSILISTLNVPSEYSELWNKLEE